MEQQPRSTRTTTTTTSTTTTSSSTTPRDRAYACAREEDCFELIINEAAQCIGQAVTPYIRQEIAGWLTMLDPQVVLYALHQTAMAPRPAWRYTHAILLRCRQQGVTGTQAAIEDQLLSGGLVSTHSVNPKRAFGSIREEEVT